MSLNQQAAKSDFREARQQAVLQQLVSNITGRPVDLLDYNEIRRHVGATGTTDRGLQQIPLDAIVGSVGRAQDFTRTFLPKSDEDGDRWVRVRKHVDRKGISPILVYKLGDVYFVNDGNHRVSIARQRGMKTIPAYVTEIETKAPLTPDDDPQKIICKARYAEFLTETGLDELRPDADLKMSICGFYHVLLNQIDAHRAHMEQSRGEPVSHAEATANWYEEVYQPLKKLIDERGLHRNFPRLTDADLYALVVHYRAELERELGWQVEVIDAVNDLPMDKVTLKDGAVSSASVEVKGKQGDVIHRIAGKVYDAVIPAAGLEGGPPTGEWREKRRNPRRERRIFADILVAGRGLPADANTLDHALLIAKREGSRVLGLRVVNDRNSLDPAELQTVQAEFQQRCEIAGAPCVFSIEEGSVVRRIVRRAAFTDLLALSVINQSGPVTKTGAGSDFNKILQRSPRPVLAVPEQAYSTMDRVLLAYDGSPKATEALYLAAYIAVRWSAQLSVVVVGQGKQGQEAMVRARSYLASHIIPAYFFNPDGDVTEEILRVGAVNDANLLVMGGFGARPLLQRLVGSTVSAMVRRFGQPVLICR
jgi:nucleotide-binding universal stress UspA family protein